MLLLSTGAQTVADLGNRPVDGRTAQSISEELSVYEGPFFPSILRSPDLTPLHSLV
jgi:hypothetical protein